MVFLMEVHTVISEERTESFLMLISSSNHLSPQQMCPNFHVGLPCFTCSPSVTHLKISSQTSSLLRLQISIKMQPTT
jgi:hypothetical protein